jgi:hypothetical protein
MTDVEQRLIDEASGVIGGGEHILGAGVFGLADLIQAQIAGGTIGGLVGAVGADAAGAGAGTFVGSLVAKQEAAAKQGASVQLLVAVTPDAIHVLNRDDSGALAPEFASFTRSDTTVDIRNLGLSRILTLTEASGAQLTLHGTVSWLSSLATGDKVVLGLLADA